MPAPPPQFLKPLLLVGLFAPPEELSAAVVLDTFYFYSLAHQASFDVCWTRGSVAETLFAPLMERMRAAGAEILGGHLMTDVDIDQSTGMASSVTCRRTDGTTVVLEADAVVFAMGVSGMQRLVQGVPALATRRFFRGMNNLKGLDVMAVRVWLDKKVDTRFSSNVLSGFQQDCGGTWFNLNDLHDEYRDAPGSVIAADFYHSNALMSMTDEDVVAEVVDSLVSCEPSFAGAKVEDFAVLRFPRAVTHFSPGSYQWRPTQETPFPNVFMAGDWIKGLPYGMNGLSQERAYVTGLRAASMVCETLGEGSPADIKDVEEDEPHVKIAKDLNSQFKRALEQAGILPSPFLF